MKKLLLFITASFLLFVNPVKAQQQPGLVIGIVIDQMRYDYIYKYWDRFGDNGFKKLVKEGFFCRNVHFNYIPTYTGPGHASIYTGATPSAHGIVANDWYSRKEGKEVYCAEDNSVKTVGADTDAGFMSPHRMLTTTITDELKLISNRKSKVVGISLKDRGAILPAGHMADGAYWLDGKSGNWVSSTFYMEQLPGWVTAYNKENKVEKWLDNVWEPLYPIESYDKSLADENEYEHYFGYYDKKIKPEQRAVFPYDLSEIKKENGLGTIKGTPWGNKLVRDFSEQVLLNEKLGEDEITDFLCMSFSSTDYVGHQFGPHSIELEDTYLRLDKEIAAFLDFVDQQLGRENVLIFLTSDHGAANVPAYLTDEQVPAGYLDKKEIASMLTDELNAQFGEGEWISDMENNNIYFNCETIESMGADYREIESFTADLLAGLDGIAYTLTNSNLSEKDYTSDLRSLVQNGFYPKRSGDVIFIPEAEWISYSKKGTTHGSGYNYDTHVPLIWYGWNIPKGEYNRELQITCIAPTLSLLLNTALPSAGSHEVIHKLLKE